MNTLNQVLSSPLSGIGLTIVAYALAEALHQRIGRLHPLLATCATLIGLLCLLSISGAGSLDQLHGSYQAGGQMLTLLLGPATVALAAPLYRHRDMIRRNLRPIVASVFVGSSIGLLVAGAVAKLMNCPREIVFSMIPKSVTTAISSELARELGGSADLAAAFTVLTGMIGSVVGVRLLQACRIRSDLAIGLAIGVSSHGIGTSRVIRDSQKQGALSGLAMALAGIVTSILVIPLRMWIANHT